MNSNMITNIVIELGFAVVVAILAGLFAAEVFEIINYEMFGILAFVGALTFTFLFRVAKMPLAEKKFLSPMLVGVIYNCIFLGYFSLQCEYDEELEGEVCYNYDLFNLDFSEIKILFIQFILVCAATFLFFQWRKNLNGK